MFVIFNPESAADAGAEERPLLLKEQLAPPTLASLCLPC